MCRYECVGGWEAFASWNLVVGACHWHRKTAVFHACVKQYLCERLGCEPLLEPCSCEVQLQRHITIRRSAVHHRLDTQCAPAKLSLLRFAQPDALNSCRLFFFQRAALCWTGRRGRGVAQPLSFVGAMTRQVDTRARRRGRDRCGNETFR